MKGLVTKSTGLWYEVKTADDTRIARLRSKFKLEPKKITNPLSVGDIVVIQPGQVADEWIITGIEERKNYVIRQSPHKKDHDQIIASNIDYGVLIVTLRIPRTSVGFIDRFLVTLEAFRIPGMIIFNKKDLYRKKEYELFNQLRVVYENIGYAVVLSSFLSDITDVREYFYGKRSLISGHSGSGKSTLVNRLIPDAKREVGEISAFTKKGIHTTTYAELLFIDQHSSVIDTPGIKELSLAEIDSEELSHYFPEMRRYLGNCKYHNCLHESEPGCAIKKQLSKDVSLDRYESYLKMLHQENYR